MSRVQLAINVSKIDAAVAFYSRLFGTEPSKRREGYANFAVAEPPLKLVLIQGGGAPGTLNHLGIEVENSARVQHAISSFVEQGVDTDVEEGVTCCYAVQDKVWVTDPDGARWEVYTVLGDADAMRPAANAVGDACCTTGADSATDTVADGAAAVKCC